jgi:hypothetical protein
VNDQEDYTPSLLAGLARYWKQVTVVVAVFAVVGAAYAWSSWSPEASMAVVVRVPDNASNPDRVTSEVAAELASPDVVKAAEEASQTSVAAVNTNWAQGESTIGVVVESSSADAAASAADALLPAYDSVVAARADAVLQSRLSTIDTAIASVDDDLEANAAELAAAAPGSARATAAQSQQTALLTQKTQLKDQRSQAQVAAAASQVGIAIAAGPDPGSGRLSVMVRYVPAAIILGLLVAMGGVAVIERRRPWIADPAMASSLLHAPLLGVGPGPGERSTHHGADAIAPVVAMSVLRAVGDTRTGIALLVSRGHHEVSDGALTLAKDMTPVLERAGAKVAVLALAASGATHLYAADGTSAEIEGFWNEFVGRNEFESSLQEAGLIADLYLLVPVADIEHELLLDLVLLADVSVVATASGALLEPLVALRRDFDALGCEPHGVVADLATR